MNAPVLMVQGTASNVGKSAVAAGLCRLLRRRGWRVAPFKALNLSLNAAVAADGGEIARSTAMQAAAAGIEPTVAMNPILLKPEGGRRTQLIVRGKVRGRLEFGGSESALDYWPIVAESLDRLRDEYDVVVAEGAGSPAEMNLRDRDIANMRVALYADAAVILVGDVERGGVFAQLVGTLDLLSAEERALVRGLVVNRFHGDTALFADGVSFLEQRTGLPVFGVLPFIRDLELPEEDAASLDRPRRRGDRDEASLRVAIVRLPHLANFDDFGPLERHPDVDLRYVDRTDELAASDLIVLPGTKSTLADLRFLRERGLAEAILAARANGTPIVGICGGFQMLGQWIDDPDQVESNQGGTAGLGFLPHATVFERDKVTQRVRAVVLDDRGPLAGIRGSEIEGYEIHVGRTEPRDAEAHHPPLRIVDRHGSAANDFDGGVSDDGLVFGTYLHGLFANEGAVQALVAWLQSRVPRHPRVSQGASRFARVRVNPVDPYDRWADVIEKALNVPLLLERCGLGA